MGNAGLRSIPLLPYNDLYFADSDGFIWKKLKGRPRHKNEKVVTCYQFHNGEWYKLLKPQVHGKNSNYLAVFLFPPRKNITVHRLVLLTFNYIPNHADFQVNHKNRNSFDNTPSNLEWVTNQENCQHRVYTSLPAPYDVLRWEWEQKFEERQKNSDFYQTQELGSWSSKYDEQKIIELLKTTDWTKQQIADHLGCSHRAVRYWQEKIKVDRPKLTLKDKIEPLLENNPSITPNQIADILQVRVTSIHAVLRKIKCND